MKNLTAALFTLVLAAIGNSVYACGDYDDLYLGFAEFNNTQSAQMQNVKLDDQKENQASDLLLTAVIDLK